MSNANTTAATCSRCRLNRACAGSKRYAGLCFACGYGSREAVATKKRRNKEIRAAIAAEGKAGAK